jgi:hypothetical protein
MKKKLIAIVIGVLALSGVVGAGLAQARNDTAKQTGQEEKGDTHENEASGSDDGEEPGDVDAPGTEAEDD